MGYRNPLELWIRDQKLTWRTDESTPEKLSEPTMRDLSHWKIPRVLFREIVNSKNATIDEIQLAEEDEALDEDDLDYEDDTEYEDGDY